MAKNLDDLNSEERQLIAKWSAEIGVTEEAIVSFFNVMDLEGEPYWSHLRQRASELANAQREESQPTHHTSHHSLWRT